MMESRYFRVLRKAIEFGERYVSKVENLESLIDGTKSKKVLGSLDFKKIEQRIVSSKEGQSEY